MNTKIIYSFEVSDDALIDSIRDYIELVRVGVNLTDDYLGVYPETERTENGRVLKFDIEVPANPFEQTIKAKFMKGLISRYEYDFKYNPHYIKAFANFE